MFEVECTYSHLGPSGFTQPMPQFVYEDYTRENYLNLAEFFGLY